MSEFDTLEFRGDGVYCACGGLIFASLPAEGAIVRCASCGNAWLYNGGSFEMKCEIGQPAVTTATLRMERAPDEDVQMEKLTLRGADNTIEGLMELRREAEDYQRALIEKARKQDIESIPDCWPPTPPSP